MLNPEPRIKVNLSTFSAIPASLGIPSFITFDVRPDVSVGKVLEELLARLPEIPYPFTITTTGSNPRILEDGQSMSVAAILPKHDSPFVTLRLNVHLPEQRKERKKGIGAKLRAALGRSGSVDKDHGVKADAVTCKQPDPRREPQHSELPTYEEATRSNS